MSTKTHPYAIPPRTTSDMGAPYERLSWHKKQANNFAWVEKVADYYDYYRGNYNDPEYIEKLRVNYDLFSGRGKEAMEVYHNTYGAELFSEGLTDGYDAIQHYPIINQFARAMVGEQQRRPLSAVAVDSSRYNMNVRKMKKQELYRNWINQNIIGPIQNEAFRRIMEQTGVEDPFKLSPEEQMEFQNMVQMEAANLTPDEIENYMRKDYKSPSETQAQRILDFLIQDLNVKYLTDEAFKHFIVSGREVVRVYTAHDRVKMDVINPMGFDYGSSSNTHFIEDGEWAKYEQYLKYPDIFSALGDKIGAKELRKLENEFIAFGSNLGANPPLHEMSDNLVATIAVNNGNVFDKAPDIRTNEGQEWVKSIYGHFGTNFDSFDSVRHVHIAFKALRKFKHITRIINGKKRGFWQDESYEFNPNRGDLEQEIFWIPQIWEVDKFGTIDGIYINKRPIPDQYKSIHNPWDVKLPYIGIEFNRMFENSKHVSPLDFGKPWQYLINLELAKIQELNATDVGKVLVNSLSYIPENWDPGKFFAMMKYGKTAWINTDQEAMSDPNASAGFLRSVDLSNTSQIMGRVQYLQFLIGWMGQAMSYNSSRMGQNERYMAVANAQQNIIQSQYQTEDIYNTHNIFLENVLNALVRTGRSAFKDNDHMRTYILDDMSIAELDINWEILDQAELGVKIRNSSEDFVKVQQIKGLSQAMVQNGLITISDLIKLQYANNGAEILNVAENAEKKLEQQRSVMEQKAEEQRQIAMQMQQQQMMMEAQLKQQKMEMDYRRAVDAASIGAQKWVSQYDVNMNQISDSYEKEQMRIAHEKEENEKDRMLKLEIERMQAELKRLEMMIKNPNTKEGA